jgi:sugar phosphate isomerase/epimerase
MQLAAITDEISQEFEHALDVMLEYGATGAELRGLWGTNIADLTDDQAARAKAALREREMYAVCLATPFFKCDLAPEAPYPGEAAGAMHLATPRGLEQQMELLTRCIRLAHLFETPLLRVFTFWRKEALTPAIEARIVDAFAAPLALAEREGVVLGLENEYACFIGTGAEAGRIAAAINSPHLKIVWDPGNAYFAGETPYPAGYDAIKPWLTHIHVKDGHLVETADQGPQARWCVVGGGEIDYVAQFAALKRDRYTGWISLETHFRPETGAGPDGKGTPEEGSRPCLAALRSLLGAS